MKKILFCIASFLLCLGVSGCVGFLPNNMYASSTPESSSTSNSKADSSPFVSEEESVLTSSEENSSSVVLESDNSSEGGSMVESTESSQQENSSSVEEIISIYNPEIVDYFKNVTGRDVLYVSQQARLKTSVDLDGTFVGGVGAEELIIDGGEAGATLTAIGGGEGAIKGKGGATLVFKNLTIVDNSSPATSFTQVRREGYLEFGGKLRFENCNFECAAYFCEDADAEFINCTFDSGKENMYAVWVSDGSVAFKGCTFTGWRAIKLYEGSDNHYTALQDFYDVESVRIEDCIFENLRKKPGIAIDVFAGEETSIVILNTQFNGCQSFSGYEGIDGVYESDVDTSTLTFVMEGVTVDGEPCVWETEREFS